MSAKSSDCSGTGRLFAQRDGSLKPVRGTAAVDGDGMQDSRQTYAADD